MGIEYDPAKDADNVAKHGVSFAQYAGFDTEPVIVVDDRADYGETRFRAFGRLEGEGYAIVFTLRGETMRLISFRRAHDKEMRRHDQ